MVEIGNPNSVTDAGVAALCARSAVLGAYMNVRINCSGYDDKAFVAKMIDDGKKIEQSAMKLEAEIIAIVNTKIGI